MNYYTLCELNIKLLDFVSLLSPLGDVKKIVSNGMKHLVEINFHNSILELTNNKSDEKEHFDKTIIKIYKDNNFGYIINNNTAILELPIGIEDNSEYLSTLKDKNKDTISKYIKKTLPKDCMKISKNKILMNSKKLTDPEKINISNFPGYRKVCV